MPRKKLAPAVDTTESSVPATAESTPTEASTPATPKKKAAPKASNKKNETAKKAESTDKPKPARTSRKTTAKPGVETEPSEVQPAQPEAAPDAELVQVAETVSEPAPITPAPKLRRTKAEKPAPAAPAKPEPKKKAAPKKAAAPTEEPVAKAAPVSLPWQPIPDTGEEEPESEPEVETPAAPVEPTSKRGGRQRGKKPELAPVVSEPIDEVLQPEEMPKRSRGGKRVEPQVVIAQVTEEFEEEPKPEGYDFASLDLPMPIWRPRGNGASPVASADETEAAETTSSEERTGDRNDDRSRRRRRRRGGRNRGEDRDERSSAEPVNEALAEDVEEEEEEPEIAPVPQEAPRREENRNRDRRDNGRHDRERRTEEPTPERKPDPAPEIPVFRRERTVAKPPEKAAIAIPENAPQVVMQNGIPTLVRDHRVYPPIMFFGSPADEKRAETVLEEVKMAAEAGVHLHSYLIDFEVHPEAVDEAAAFAAYMLSRSVQTDPESQVIFRLVFQAPRGWEAKYPNGRYRYTDGVTAEPSVCDDEFWSVARTCLEKFVKKMCLLDLSKHIMGLHLERGEWFFAEGVGYDNSNAAQTKFRDWARLRYLNDEVTLRASWFDGGARFENITVPEYQPEGQDGDRFIRSSRRQRRYVDYHLFLSDATVQRVADLAYAAKAASEGTLLIGASYGYTFEWSHPASGHLSLGKLLRTPEIDFIAGPPSYRSRQPGGTAAFPGPIDSFALNGKLYISEEDFKTSLSVGHEPDDFNPQLKTPQALESVHWRGVGAALAHASGLSWMDVWGNGWLRTNSVWERAKKVREAMIDRLAAPLDDPEVAVFIDERALGYLVDDHAFKLLVQNVRESVLRAGVSAAFYLLSDLTHREKFPDSKLYVFVNAWDVRPELRAAIKSRLQRDGKVLFWLYSAGLFDAGRESLERAREVTGIAIKPQPFNSKAGTTILNRRHPLSEAFPDKTIVGGTKLDPSYFAIPEGATVLGEYTQTGLPSFVVKEFKEGSAETHWTSVFLGEPQVNPALIRALAQMAGAHVWNFQEDVVHVRHPFLTVHCQAAGPRTLTLPGKYSAYNLLRDDWSGVDSSQLRFTAVEGATYCFLVGARDELEQQLHTDPSKLLFIEKIPPRDANVRVDGLSFDVPMMRLEGWMESNDTDDNADEWFLRPQQVEEEPMAQATVEESPEKVGRRRRRRGGKDRERGERGSAPTETRAVSTTPVETIGGDDFELNVMFRKRE